MLTAETSVRLSLRSTPHSSLALQETMSPSNPSSQSPFLHKTYDMVDEPSSDSVVSWSVTGLTFIVRSPLEFSRDMLPKYFKHSNFSSFIRQLNTYGFRKVDPHQWEFANGEFVRGQRHLLKNILRRKPTHSHANAAPLSDGERREFLSTVENLQREKLALESELERHKQENREYEDQLQSLGETLQNIDRRQAQLMDSLDRLLQQEPRQNKKRRLLALQHSSPSPSSLPNLLSTDLVEKLDSYVIFWDKFIDEIDCFCSPEVAAATSDSPPTPSISIDQETDNKSSSSSSSGVDGGAVEENDFFWQQFLTESPDSPVGQKTQSDDHSGLVTYHHNKPWRIHVLNG